MKKIMCALICIVMLLGLMIPALADDMKVCFTSDSSFQVGGTATVDPLETAISVMDSGSVSSEMYNAALDRNMTYLWRCSNGPDKTGQSVTWTEEDAGREYFCRVSFYGDMACTQFVDYIDSDVFIVSGGQSSEPENNDPPEFTTKTLPDATVGEAYAVTLKSTDPDAQYSIAYNPGKANDFETLGFRLTVDGVITGTPTKAGTYGFAVCASNPYGEGYMEYTLVVKEAEAEEETAPSDTPPVEEITEPVPTRDVADGTLTVGALEPESQKTSGGSLGLLFVLATVILIMLAVPVAVIILIIVLIRKKSAGKSSTEE